MDEGHLEGLWNQFQRNSIAMCHEAHQQSGSTFKNNIDVRHHFIRDHQQKRDICIKSVGTDDQLANIFTKPLDETRFSKGPCLVLVIE